MKNTDGTTVAAAQGAPLAAEPTYACTVLITPTTIGDLICGAGHKLRLSKTDAEALAAMEPPRISIDGI